MWRARCRPPLSRIMCAEPRCLLCAPKTVAKGPKCCYPIQRWSLCGVAPAPPGHHGQTLLWPFFCPLGSPVLARLREIVRRWPVSHESIFRRIISLFALRSLFVRRATSARPQYWRGFHDSSLKDKLVGCGDAGKTVAGAAQSPPFRGMAYRFILSHMFLRLMPRVSAARVTCPLWEASTRTRYCRS